MNMLWTTVGCIDGVYCMGELLTIPLPLGRKLVKLEQNLSNVLLLM